VVIDLEDLARAAAEHGASSIVQVGDRPHFHMIACEDVLAIARAMAALEVRRLLKDSDALPVILPGAN
jgi:hypothetical protein